MNSKECLDLAILEYEKDLETDKNNQWVKNVLKGLKEIKQDLDRLEKENQGVKEDNTRLWHSIEYANNEIAKLRKGFKLLKDSFEVIICRTNFPISVINYSIGFRINNDGVWAHVLQEDCELLEEVFNYD